MNRNEWKNLKDVLKQLTEATVWLNRSFKICHEFGNTTHYTPEQLDALEALAGRFARVVDMLINKVFRSIDVVELESGGTIIDVVNRAHKRKLFKNVDDIRLLKDLRNQISHEYTSHELMALFQGILKYTPILLEIVCETKKYAIKKEGVYS